jgi:hypothetical protein
MHCWRSDPPGTAIKLAAKDFVVLVRKDAAKKAGHPSLWRELDSYLKKRGYKKSEGYKNSKQPTTRSPWVKSRQIALEEAIKAALKQDPFLARLHVA